MEEMIYKKLLSDKEGLNYCELAYVYNLEVKNELADLHRPFLQKQIWNSVKLMAGAWFLGNEEEGCDFKSYALFAEDTVRAFRWIPDSEIQQLLLEFVSIYRPNLVGNNPKLIEKRAHSIIFGMRKIYGILHLDVGKMLVYIYKNCLKPKS